MKNSTDNPELTVLRAISPFDARGLLRLFRDHEVRRFLGGSVPLFRAWRRVTVLIAFGRGLDNMWAISDKHDKFMGTVSLMPHHDGADHELSYALLPEFQGHGHAHRACLAVLERAFNSLHMDKVVSETQCRNEASVRLATRLGMELERRVSRFGHEQCVYAINQSSFGTVLIN